MAERIDEIGFGGLKLIQDTDYFCYGVDAVLLADFASRSGHKKIADLGTNNAVIPVIMAGITDAELITGIEKQESPALLAERNVQLNGFSGRINIINTDILDIAEHMKGGSCDAVTCNPPYTERGTGPVNGENAMTAARHETTASLDDFIRCAAYLLKDKGMFYMIHRPSRIVDIACSCRANRLEPKLLQFISPREGEKPNLMLIQCRKNGGRELKLLDPLNVYGNDGNYTEEIMKIYRRI
jgi:tRNA1Val (adenine37-N6)-methyltransferase